MVKTLDPLYLEDRIRNDLNLLGIAEIPLDENRLKKTKPGLKLKKEEQEADLELFKAKRFLDL